MEARSDIDYSGAMVYLANNCWPLGLQYSLLRNVETVPIRYFICDDSASMKLDDGHRLIGQGDQKVVIKSTRWEELQDFVKFHAGLADAANAKCNFRFLNSGTATIVGTGDNGDSYQKLVDSMQSKPHGRTPLCHHIKQVIHEIQGICVP